jgi:eukaryotic-like serine/threonine-protein kinase
MKLDARALVGRTLNATYRLVRPIGSGGMGAILEAQNARLAHKRYAVKLLHPSLAMDPDTFHRFRREAEIASSLGHDHIVEVHDFNVTPEGEPYMVMEFLDGDDLAARIKARGPMSLADTSIILTQVASALEAAHAAGIVHRDLKPQNIFLCKRFGRDDFVKVLDFGVSKMRDSSSVVTRDHALLGTPFYMSPEQADGRVAEIDGRTDLFALGAILHEMLTGQMAFYAETPMAALYKVVHGWPPEVHTVRPDIPPSISAVLRRALAKDKRERYEVVTDLAAAFAEVVAMLPPAHVQARPRTSPGAEPSLAFAHTATPSPPLSQAAVGSIATMSRATGQVIDSRPPQRRSRVLVWGVAAFALSGGAGIVALATRGPGPSPSPPPPPIAATPPAPVPVPVPEKIAAPPAPAILTVQVTPPKAKAAIKLDGKRVTGPELSVPRGTEEVTVEVEAPGYFPAMVKIVPDGNKPVPVTLRPKSASSGSYNREFMKPH